MVNAISRWSFFKKQLIVALGINTLTLLISTLVLYQHFYHGYRNELKNTMQSKSNLLSATTASALVFNDESSVNNLLANVEKHPSTSYVQILTADKLVFAQHVRSDGIAILAEDQLPEGFSEFGRYLYLRHSIYQDGELLGYVILCSDTRSLRQQQQRLILVLSYVFLFTTLLASLLIWSIQRHTLAPIRELIALAKYVASSQNYDRRIPMQRGDEIGELIDGVNNMLDTIEAHKLDSQFHTEKLENLVALRTKQLFHRANYDILTRLPNRYLLLDRLSHAINNAERDGSLVAVLFLDLDRFKLINDSLGHFVGDQLLKIVAYKLCYVLRKADSVCRWGGDEFVVLIERVIKREAINVVCEKIIECLSEPCLIQEHRIHASTSIGVAIYPDHGNAPSDLIKYADISMYRAKQSGPSGYCFFENAMLTESLNRLSLEASVRAAVEQDAFYLVYQPQICLRKGHVCGVEALIRWQHEGRSIPPNEFLPVIEELGLMQTLSQWIIRQACEQISAWKKAGHQLTVVAINIPGSVLGSAHCVELFEEPMKSTGLLPQEIEIEITENTFIDNTEQVLNNLKCLRNRGLGVAIDDFGTGYSCLSYLKDLPITKIKIDGTFIAAMDDDAATHGIVSAIVALAKGLGLVLVAECVETEKQLALLQAMDVDLIQGYFFSKPLPAHEVPDFLVQNAGKKR